MQSQLKGATVAAPLQVIKRQIEACPVQYLPDILTSVIKRCIATRIYGNRKVHMIAATIEKKLLGK